eukprot:TRINITY_DN18011_c0_g1_i2.p1 TRINITY_DN18011_c0_g1~~TRINITY_DN18011_c0_g1_i2.p1  ORF type:complete len:141 (+),score=22.63 TRINITY_DN18011_c0_g1_i2:180-602(+)
MYPKLPIPMLKGRRIAIVDYSMKCVFKDLSYTPELIIAVNGFRVVHTRRLEDVKLIAVSVTEAKELIQPIEAIRNVYISKQLQKFVLDENVPLEDIIQDKQTHISYNPLIKLTPQHNVSFASLKKPVSYTHLTLPTICSV